MAIPQVTMPKRSVSPLGASKFERPLYSVQHRESTSTASNDAEDIQALPTRHSKWSDDSTTINGHADHLSKPSPTSTVPTYNTALTAPSDSQLQSEDGHDSTCPPSHDRETWFSQQTEQEQEIAIDGDKCPDRATLAAVQDLIVYDSSGKAIRFGSLYDPAHSPHQRQLIIFVRYFYCPACQAFVEALTRGISVEDYFNIPTPTSLVIISCGQPDLIPQYAKLTSNCPFTVLTDPTRTLFKKLGMGWSMSMGHRPEYMPEPSLMKTMRDHARKIGHLLKEKDGLRKRDLVRGGNMLQLGGEFLFEDGQVIWCHRMRNLRGHAEVSVLRRVLDLDG